MPEAESQVSTDQLIQQALKVLSRFMKQPGGESNVIPPAVQLEAAKYVLENAKSLRNLLDGDSSSHLTGALDLDDPALRQTNPWT